MRKYGLVGYPLGHSFSKKYFTEKFDGEHITDCSYENFPLDDINKFPSLLKDNPDLYGLNITIPYKTQVLEYVDVRDTAVDEIGAANVLKIKREGDNTKVYGFNSDVTGIHDSILPHLTKNLKSALILGTGGSSRAVAWTLKKMGINYTLISRDQKPGAISYSEINSNIISRIQLIINTTPLGMYPDIASCPELDYDLLDKRHILFDLVYNPEMTTFLRSGQERGCSIITGLRMLYSQAEKSWEIWNNDNL
jgi:shikimate dehydrogenase